MRQPKFPPYTNTASSHSKAPYGLYLSGAGSQVILRLEKDESGLSERYTAISLLKAKAGLAGRLQKFAETGTL